MYLTDAVKYLPILFTILSAPVMAFGVSLILKRKKTATAKNKISPKKSIRKRPTHKKGSVKRKSRYRSKYMAVKKVDTVRQNTLQVISSNKEKARINDSLHNALISHQGEGVFEKSGPGSRMTCCFSTPKPCSTISFSLKNDSTSCVTSSYKFASVKRTFGRPRLCMSM